MAVTEWNILFFLFTLFFTRYCYPLLDAISYHPKPDNVNKPIHNTATMPAFHTNVDGSSLSIEFEDRGVKQRIEVPDMNLCWKFPIKYVCGHPVESRPGKPMFAQWKRKKHCMPCKLRGCKIKTGKDHILGAKCFSCDHQDSLKSMK